MDTQSLGRMLTRVRQALLDERVDEGHWQGELSSSALSTATSLVALSLVNQELHRERCQRAVVWLEESQNEDGGWGDTIKSLSNLSTTLLVWAALRQGGGRQERMDRARLWVERQVGGSDPNRIRQAVMDRYGKDRTFSIPIIMMGTICGIFEEDDRQAWSKVWPLPFELAAFPRRWYAALQFPVVSYALPALIAIGYARNYHCPPFFLGRVRQGIWPGVSRLLKEIQPSTGGYLEAAPLTSFVTMALASAGQKEHAVIPEAVRFLENSQREDGSWPIDTNLATWVTTLAIKALGSEHGEASYGEEQQKALRSWLLDQQYRETHPFTGAAPGGWAWTNLAGGVPDADDTPGALLSLALLSAEPNAEDREAAERGCAWLLDRFLAVSSSAAKSLLWIITAICFSEN
ncbi:MAG: prenyltransferase/squalene oxidase repeat-containing protein [Verrucomicrobiota bacterium]